MAKGRDCSFITIIIVTFLQEAFEDAWGKVRTNGQGESTNWNKYLFNLFFLKSLFFSQVDAEKIMEEILGMKAGLNPDQQVKVQTLS